MARIKTITGLDCAARADKMLRLVLLAQLKAMCQLRSKALDWEDPEGVHDMRVFSRRLRTAISDFRPYLGKAELPVLELKKIAKALGAVRDEDVALIALEGFKSNVSDEVTAGLEMFAQEGRARQEEARAALKKIISPQAIKQFRQEFQAKLKITPPPRTRHPSKGNLSFMDVGVKVITTRLNELTAASKFIYLPFESLGIHELRILAKRLRYAIQSFSLCFGKEAEELAKEISLLQDSLGALHDCDVWIERLAKRIVQTGVSANDGKGTLRKAAVWLLGHLANLRAEHYRQALTRWHRWEAEGFLTSIKSMLDQKVVAQVNAP